VPLAGDPLPEVSVAVAEPAEDVEDEDAILHGPVEIAERVRHTLHPAAELADREVPLDEGPEAHVETQGPGLGVAWKLPLERKPGSASVRGGAHGVVEVGGDRPENPAEDDAVEAQP